MRVPQLCGYVEPKVFRIFNSAVPEFDANTSSLLESLFEQQWFQNRIQFFSNVFKQDWCAKLDAVFKRADEIRVCEFYDMKVLRFLHVFDPLVGLSLGVYHQRPATSIAEE